ncbi:histidine phosphotransferase [Tabrizicola sp. TH137]|uniref:histidine phosphotransferase family protein n=1 Tax=Tabrizicola sp. TH137 TaxID=2067452 RepID=UPI000C79DACE|nr:histidine phosphotransferase family protein [Tabrizicola sp. TH137]PLL12294.1 histidine phosphotransferase [Tabrizicola sp. TH137]
MFPQPDLTALLGSRLCHDLIGPIGAIGNGVELLTLSGSGTSDEVALIAQSVATLNARIRFFRVAFGIARPDQTLSRAEVQSILADLHPSGRLAIDWASPATLARIEVKAAFLCLLCAETALRSNGHLRALRDEVGWSVTLTSPRLRHDDGLWSRLLTPDAAGGDPLDPSEVHFPLAAAAIAALGRRPDLEPGPGWLRLSF